jgi:hypothetical protein
MNWATRMNTSRATLRWAEPGPELQRVRRDPSSDCQGGNARAVVAPVAAAVPGKLAPAGRFAGVTGQRQSANRGPA